MIVNQRIKRMEPQPIVSLSYVVWFVTVNCTPLTRCRDHDTNFSANCNSLDSERIPSLFNCYYWLHRLSEIPQKDTSFTLNLLTGIKQGLPLSPWLFLFYVNGIFDFFEGILPCNVITETLHLLIHADNTTIIAGRRESAERMLRSLKTYCFINHIYQSLPWCSYQHSKQTSSHRMWYLIWRNFVGRK